MVNLFDHTYFVQLNSHDGHVHMIHTTLNLVYFWNNINMLRYRFLPTIVNNITYYTNDIKQGHLYVHVGHKTRIYLGNDN